MTKEARSRFSRSFFNSFLILHIPSAIYLYTFHFTNDTVLLFLPTPLSWRLPTHHVISFLLFPPLSLLFHTLQFHYHVITLPCFLAIKIFFPAHTKVDHDRDDPTLCGTQQFFSVVSSSSFSSPPTPDFFVLKLAGIFKPKELGAR